MKNKYLSVLKIIIIVLVIEIVLMGLYYIFVYDKNKPRVFEPQLGYGFLEEQIEKIKPITENAGGEIMLTQDDFEGIFRYWCSKNTSDEINNIIADLDSKEGIYRHIVFPNDSYEIYVRNGYYMDIINAWQYGWWDRQGNLYADWNGHDKAKGKPNYRYYYCFKVLKNNDLYSIDVYCNIDDAEKVFSVCIENINKLE